jgi:hypothetical protein
VFASDRTRTPLFERLEGAAYGFFESFPEETVHRLRVGLSGPKTAAGEPTGRFHKDDGFPNDRSPQPFRERA